MSHGGDDTEACCILGVCCRRGGKKQAKKLVAAMAKKESSGPLISASSLLSTYQLIPLDLLEERTEFAQLLDYELKGYLERRGVAIKAESEDDATET